MGDCLERCRSALGRSSWEGGSAQGVRLHLVTGVPEWLPSITTIMHMPKSLMLEANRTYTTLIMCFPNLSGDLQFPYLNCPWSPTPSIYIKEEEEE